MTPTQRKAMGQAIDALDEASNVLTSSMFTEAIAALFNALAEPAPEPMAHLWQHGETGRTRVVMPDSVTDCDASWQLIGPLYLAAPVREPAPVPLLTDDELKASGCQTDIHAMLARAIEQAVRQKAGL